MQGESARQHGTGKDLESALFEKHKTIMALKGLTYGISTNLLWHEPKWNSANHGLELCNDEVGVIKRSGCICMEDQY